MSRTKTYSTARIGIAMFAAFAVLYVHAGNDRNVRILLGTCAALTLTCCWSLHFRPPHTFLIGMHLLLAIMLFAGVSAGLADQEKNIPVWTTLLVPMIAGQTLDKRSSTIWGIIATCTLISSSLFQFGTPPPTVEVTSQKSRFFPQTASRTVGQLVVLWASVSMTKQALRATQVRREEWYQEKENAVQQSRQIAVLAGKLQEAGQELTKTKTHTTNLQNTNIRLKSANIALKKANRRIESTNAFLSTEKEVITHQALHDSLTGLPNRLQFLERLECALSKVDTPGNERKNGPSVMFVDLDKFKPVNDMYGHRTGDLLLQQIAERLMYTARKEDIVARFGGDEFVILCENIPDIAALSEFAERLIRTIQAPYRLDPIKIDNISASIGIAVASPYEFDAEALLRRADAAMYKAKQHGGHYWYISTEESVVSFRLPIEEEIERALDRQEFFLSYEPVINLQTHKLVAVEALIRWHHPKMGLLFPGDFLPHAERSDIIHEIGGFVLRQACNDLASWRAHSREMTDLMICVNLAGAQLQNNSPLLETVEKTVHTTSVPWHRICFDISESCFESPHTAPAILHELHNKGIQLAVDNFGTGAGSRAYLTQLPLDIVKIDRSHVAALAHSSDDHLLVHSAVAMAHAMNLRTIGEGIETYKQFEILTNLSCDYGQGQYFRQFSLDTIKQPTLHV